MVRGQSPDLSNLAATYLEEAVATFYAECMLASCVMLGVAAEVEFLELVEVAARCVAQEVPGDAYGWPN